MAIVILFSLIIVVFTGDLGGLITAGLGIFAIWGLRQRTKMSESEINILKKNARKNPLQKLLLIVIITAIICFFKYPEFFGVFYKN